MAGHPARHLVSVWAGAARLVLAHQAVADHSHAITALPRLLAPLELAGCSVTIDAMGCQRPVAALIVEPGAEYALALKVNQKANRAETYEAVGDACTLLAAASGVHHTQDRGVTTGHGRLKWRRGTVMDDPAVLAWRDPAGRWADWRALGPIEAQRPIGAARGAVATR